MNSVQTNIMNVAPIPNPSAKANAAEAVRPVGKTARTTDKGAGNASFDKALAKLKSMKQELAESAKGEAADPLAASLAASQQQTKTAKETTPADNAEAAAAAEAVPETAPLEAEASPLGTKASAVGQNPAVETVAALLSEEMAETVSDEADVPVEKTVLPVSTDGFDGLAQEEPSGAVQDAAKTSLPAAKADAQPRKDLGVLDALLPANGEKAEANLLDALAGRSRLQQMQPALTMNPVQAADLPEAAVQQTAAPQTAALPDELLRTLAAPETETQAAVLAQAQTPADLRQADAKTPAGTAQTAAQTVAAAFEGAVLQVQEAGQPADGETGDALANPFARQPVVEAEAKADSAVQTVLTQAKPQGAEAFLEAAAKPLETRAQAETAPQVNPGVTFQHALAEAAPTEAPAQAAAPDYEVPRQIVDQARLLRLPEQTEMVIRLKPEHLGELTLKVSVAANGAVNASFHTDNAAVRTIIETSMIQLKQELQAQGLKVDNVGVYAGLSDSSLMNGQQDANAFYAQQGRQGSSHGKDVQQALASFEEEQAAADVSSRTGVIASDGVDYRI